MYIQNWDITHLKSSLETALESRVLQKLLLNGLKCCTVSFVDGWCVYLECHSELSYMYATCVHLHVHVRSRDTYPITNVHIF